MSSMLARRALSRITATGAGNSSVRRLSRRCGASSIVTPSRISGTPLEAEDSVGGDSSVRSNTLHLHASQRLQEPDNGRGRAVSPPAKHEEAPLHGHLPDRQRLYEPSSLLSRKQRLRQPSQAIALGYHRLDDSGRARLDRNVRRLDTQAARQVIELSA